MGFSGSVTTQIRIAFERGDRFHAHIRQHHLAIDQPLEEGGEDWGPTPVELFVASLAGCVGYYAERFLRRHNLSPDGLRVDASYEMAGDRPARVGSIQIDVDIPAELSPERQTALARVLDHCTVHNSIRTPPAVAIAVQTGTGPRAEDPFAGAFESTGDGGIK